MDATYIILTYVHLDDTLKRLNWQDHHHASVSTAEVLTVAVIAAKYFQNHHERALLQFLGRQRAAHVYARFQRLYGDLWGQAKSFLAYDFTAIIATIRWFVTPNNTAAVSTGRS